MAGVSDGKRTQAEDPVGRATLWDVRETRIRLPGKGVHELKRVADAKGITMNALIAGYIDAGLKTDGRRGLYQLASWFSDYLRRKGGRGSVDYRPSTDGDDFI